MLFTVFRRSRLAGFIVAAVAGALLALGIAASAVRAQSASTDVNLVYLLGNDTIATEKFAVTPASWSGELVWKGQPRIDWKQSLSGSTMGNYTLGVFPPGSAADAKPAQRALFTRVRDSVRVDMTSGTASETQVVPFKPGAFILFNRSLANITMIGNHVVAQGKSAFDVVLVQGADALSGTARRAGDTLVVMLQGVEMRAQVDAKGLPIEIVVPSQGLRIVRAGMPTGNSSGAQSATNRSSSINYDAPANAPYTAEHVRIPTGRGYELAATYTRPTMNRLVGVAITISGSGGQDRDSRISIVPGYAFFREIADTLARRGIATLRFDDRGIGESGGTETLRTATSADFADDVRSIVAWLRARPDVDTSKIMLIGHSEGAIIAPMVAAQDADIHAIALLAGTAYNGKRIMLHQNEDVMKANGVPDRQRDSVMKTIPARLDSLGRESKWIGFFMQHEPLPTLRRVKQPVLIVQGETDHQVTPEQADSLAHALHTAGNHNVLLRKFPETNHLFLEDPSGVPQNYGKLKKVGVRKEVLGTIADWVVSQAGSK